MDVVTFGFAVSDLFVQPVDEKIFAEGGRTVEPIDARTGGDALNCAVDCSKFGVWTGTIFKVGKDLYGRHILDAMKQTGVDTSRVVEQEGIRTSMAIVLRNGASRVVLNNNMAGNLLSYDDMDMDYLKQAKIVHYGSAGMGDTLDKGDAVKIFKELREAGVKTSMDTCFRSKTRKECLACVEKLLPYVDFFLPNDEEVEKMTGLRDMEEIEAFFRPYGVGFMLVKQGPRGAYITDFKENRREIPTIPVEKVVDTTGCGDSVCAAFISSYVWGWDVEQAAMYGMAAGAINCGTVGATEGIRPKAETLQFLKDNKGCFSADLQEKINNME